MSCSTLLQCLKINKMSHLNFFLNSRMKKRKQAYTNETFFRDFQTLWVHSSLVLLFSTYILNFMEQSVIYQNVNTFIASNFLKILSFVVELKRIYYGMTDSPPIIYQCFRGTSSVLCTWMSVLEKGQGPLESVWLDNNKRGL